MLKKLLIAAGLLLAVALVIVSADRSSRISERSDYYVYWQTGKDFFEGEEIYGVNDNRREFIYPPFAAFIFQSLAVIPLRISANIFFLLNVFVLLPLAVFLIYRILMNYGLDKRRIRWPVILSVIASLKFFWNNLTMFQINFLVFVLILAGIYFVSLKKRYWGGVLFTIATFIKIYPLLLLIWSFFTHAGKRSFIAIALTVTVCFSFPLIQRGIGKGWNDHYTYYEVFLKEFKEGKIKAGEKNHNLKAFVFKALAPDTINKDINANDFPVLNTFANVILVILLIFSAFLAWYNQKYGSGLLEIAVIASILIFTHMISGITWTAHLVTTMFSYLPLFLVNPEKLNSRILKMFHYLLMTVAFFLTLEGSDTTGKTIYTAIRQVDIFVIFPLILFGYYSWMILYRKDELWIHRSIDNHQL